jgi:hypothetical protein
MTHHLSATQADSAQSSEAAAQNDIARLAYVLWQQHGYPEGSAEGDWVEAEQKLRESSVHPTLDMIRD